MNYKSINNMKTIMMTISRGGTARNILQNDFFGLLKSNFKKVYIITTAADDKRFRQEFGAENVIFLPTVEEKAKRLERYFTKVYKFIVFNRNTIRLCLYDTERNDRSYLEYTKQYIKYLFIKTVFQPLTWLKFPRRILQKIDYKFFQKNVVREYRDLIRRHKPDIVFSTSMMEDSEAALLKAARQKGVKTVAMPKTWDNPSKKYFRARADIIAAWSPFMKRQMMRLHDYKDEEIKIFGVPQFDYYTDKSRLKSREEFCSEMGLDPNKKILFFGSEGKLMPTDSNIVGYIYDFINKKELKEECQILVRPHFAYKGDRDKFKDFFDKENVVVENFNNPSDGFRDSWDYSRAQMNHFLNSIYHSDIIISTCSTLALDGIALNRPAVVIEFEGEEKKPLFRSVRRWYICDYYERILNLGGVYEAKNINGLKEIINSILSSPQKNKENENKVRDEFCYKVDGRAGRRLFNIIKNYTEASAS